MKFKPSLVLDGIKFVPSFRLNKGYTRLNYLHLDVTSKCNLKCKMCEWRYKVNRKEMPWKTYKKAIDEGKRLGLRKIVIAATGESLTHPHFSKMIFYAHENGLDIELVTNLTITTDEHLNAILKVKKLVVSLDGATKDVYEKIRVGANFEKTIQNLKQVLKKKEGIYVQINYVIQKDNFFEIDKIADLLAELDGVNEVSFKFPNNEVEEIYNAIKLSGEDIKILESKLKVAAEKLKKSNIKSNLDTPFEFGKPWIHEVPCYNLWFGAFINPDGLVMPCCDFYREKDSLGILESQNMKEIWNSKKYNDIRRRFKGRKPKICEGCPGDNRRYHNLLLKVPFHKILLGI